jgi:hypothetical protein
VNRLIGFSSNESLSPTFAAECARRPQGWQWCAPASGHGDRREQAKPRQSPASKEPDNLAGVGAEACHFVFGHQIQSPHVRQLFNCRRSALVIENMCQLPIASLHQPIDSKVPFMARFDVISCQPFNVGEDALAEALKGNRAKLTKKLPI